VHPTRRNDSEGLEGPLRILLRLLLGPFFLDALGRWFLGLFLLVHALAHRFRSFLFRSLQILIRI